MNEVYTEKEILGDALNSEKNATTLYNLELTNVFTIIFAKQC